MRLEEALAISEVELALDGRSYVAPAARSLFRYANADNIPHHYVIIRKGDKLIGSAESNMLTDRDDWEPWR